MKSLTEHLTFEVPARRGFINITSTVEDLVRRSGVREGLCLVAEVEIPLRHGHDDLVAHAVLDPASHT